MIERHGLANQVDHFDAFGRMGFTKSEIYIILEDYSRMAFHTANLFIRCTLEDFSQLSIANSKFVVTYLFILCCCYSRAIYIYKYRVLGLATFSYQLPQSH
jgi:hypothetical protein